MPLLTGTIGLGTHDLVCLVLGAGPQGIDAWDQPPEVPEAVWTLLDRRAPRRSVPAVVATGLGARVAGRLPRPGPALRYLRRQLRSISRNQGS